MVAVKMVKKELNEEEIKKFLFSCSYALEAVNNCGSLWRSLMI
jgi:hypothetical protein